MLEREQTITFPELDGCFARRSATFEFSADGLFLYGWSDIWNIYDADGKNIGFYRDGSDRMELVIGWLNTGEKIVKEAWAGGIGCVENAVRIAWMKLYERKNKNNSAAA